MRVHPQKLKNYFEGKFTTIHNKQSERQKQVKANVELPTSEICQNLIEILIVFGKNSFDQYLDQIIDQNEDIFVNQIQKSQSLLGLDNHYIKNQNQQGLLNLADFFCNYDIVYDSSTKIDSEIRELFLDVVQGCLKKARVQDNQYQCPSLDMNSQQITQLNSFCLNLEKKEQVDDDKDNIKYEYSFLNKEQQDQCLILADIYNFCVEGYNALFPEAKQSICQTKDFQPFFGASISNLNQINKKKCQNLVLPYIIFMSKELDLTQSTNLKFCQSSFQNIKSKINEQIQELLDSKSSLEIEKNKIMITLMNLQSIRSQLISFTKLIINSERNWAQGFAQLLAFIEIKNKLNQADQKIIEDMRMIIDNLFSLGGSLNKFLQTPIFAQGSLLKNQQIIENWILRINKTLSNFDTQCGQIQNNFKNSSLNGDLQQSEDQLLNMEDDQQEISELSNSQIESLNNKFIDAKTNFEGFLSAAQKKFRLESQKVMQEQGRLQNIIDDYYQSIRALQDQKEINKLYYI